MSSETPWVEPVTESAVPKPTAEQLRTEARRRIEEHLARTLSEDDRNAIRKAVSTTAIYSNVAPYLGIAVGLLGAHRLRANKIAMLRAFRTQERPTHVVFANGRTEPINAARILKPTSLGDLATYASFVVCGGSLFWAVGLLLAGSHGERIVAHDFERFERIAESARPLFADVMRTEADILASGDETSVLKLIGNNSSFLTLGKKG